MRPRCRALVARPKHQAVELRVDFPAGASVEPGAIAGLAGAIAVMGGSGDYSPLRGAPAFPRLH